MAVMNYRTEDGFTDYGFSLEFHQDRGWRIYIGFTPVYSDDYESLSLPYQSIDDHGRRYIDWPSRIDGLGDAKTVAALWAEVVNRYIHDYMSAKKERGMIDRYTYTQNQRRSSSTSPEMERKRASPGDLLPREDRAIIQQIRFSERDFAVFDISPEISAVNWTSGVTPGHFVSEISRIATPLDTDPVFLQMSSEPRGTEITMLPLRRMISNEGFDNDCEFLRIDLSPTRSVAWQILPGEGDSFTVTGIGEETARVVASDSQQFLGELLSATATSPVNGRAVISALALPLALQTGSYHGEDEQATITAAQHSYNLVELRGAATWTPTEVAGIRR